MRKNQIDESPKVIFLVGAGASVPFGIPAMQGIFKAFMDSKKSGIGQEEKKTCKLFIHELGVKEDLEEFLLAANKIVEFNNTSLSMFIEKVVAPRKGNHRTQYNAKLNEYIENVRNARTRILKFMSRTCFQFDRSKACDILGGFVTEVGKRRYPIYTTNYDFAFEHVADEQSIKVHDNFIRKGRQQIWNPSIYFPNEDGLTIIQLHGSVTWYATDNEIIEKIDHDTSINPQGQNVDRIVVFPTRFKDIYEQHFFPLYSHFLSALSKAECLIVIGHSLRDEYLRAGIIERHRKGDFRIIIIDPIFPEQLLKEITPAKVGSSGKVTHIPYYFEVFSDELASIVKNVEPINIASKCSEIVYHIKSKKKNKIRIKGNIGSLKSNAKKKFEAVIDAYLQKGEKPAYVRVWLEAKYQKNGTQKNEITTDFLEDKEISIATSLSGRVKTNLPLTIKVPEIPDWINHANKVVLCVGILKKNIKAPSNANRHILVKDIRRLRYTR